MSTLVSLEQTLLELPRESRMFLVDRLISSLNLEEPDRIDAAWIDEAGQRYSAYKAGNTKPIPYSQVLLALEQKLT